MRRLPEKFAGLGRLPKSEIARVSLVVAVYIDARAGLDAGDVEFRKLAVIRKLRDAKIDRAVADVREALRGEPLDELHHVLDVVGGADHVLGHFQAQHATICKICFDVSLGVGADVRMQLRWLW